MVDYHIVMLGDRAEAVETVCETARVLEAEMSFVGSAAEAIARKPDVIVVELSGPASVAAIGECAKGESAPIVAVVVGDNKELVERAAEAGATGFITLPVHAAEARATLETSCRLGRHERGKNLDARATLPYDTTERVEAERALRSTVGRVDLLLRSLPLFVFEIEVSWQNRLEVGELDISGSVAGYQMAELSAGEFAELIHPDDMPAMLESWSDFARGAVDHWSHEYRVIARDGAVHWLLGRGTRISPQRMLGFSLDITDRRDLESKLVHAGKMEAVGRLAGGVAHDFNNLLTSIVNFTWYVRDELPAESPLREDLGEVLKAAESGARLTSQLLAFSRRRPTEATVVELNERVDQMRRVLERTIGENIRLEFRRSPQILPAIIDPGQLDQLVFNLAVNARDAMPGGGTLMFDLRAEGGMAVLEVVDDGTGIPLHIQDRLFEPFFSTKGENGTGLGLATCYGIARQAGGDIVVESQEGAGAKFVVRLPLASLQSETPMEEDVRVSRRTNAPSVALVVEDQPAILKLVRRALEHAGWSVHTAASAEEAIAIAASPANSVSTTLSQFGSASRMKLPCVSCTRRTGRWAARARRARRAEGDGRGNASGRRRPWRA